MLRGLPLDALAARRQPARVAARAARVIAVGLHPLADRFRTRQVRAFAGRVVQLHESLPDPRHVADVARRFRRVHVARSQQRVGCVRGADAPVVRRVVPLHVQQRVADRPRPRQRFRGALRHVCVDDQRVVVGERVGVVLLFQHAAAEALHQAQRRSGRVAIHHLVEELVRVSHARSAGGGRLCLCGADAEPQHGQRRKRHHTPDPHRGRA